MTMRTEFVLRLAIGMSICISFPTVAADAPTKVETIFHPAALVISGPELKVADLQPPTPLPAGQEFGFSTAISNTDVVITAPKETDSYGMGVANVFSRDGTGMFSGAATIPQPYGRPSGSSSSEFFTANAVAIDDDTIAVGGPLAPIWPNPYQGEVDIYSRDDSGWYLSDILFDSGDINGQLFGCALAMSGNTLVVSACNYDFSGGRAYVYVKSNGHWDVQALLTSTDHVSGQYFAYTAAIDGNTVVLGAPIANNSAGKTTGAAYVFVRSGAVWSDGIRLDIAGEDEDFFGASVSVSGKTVVVGAPGKSVDATANAGAAYVYQRSGAAWTLQTELVSPTAGESGAFGSSVAVAGNRLVIGEMQASAAHVFTGTGTGWLREASIYGTTNTNFGASVSMSTSSFEYVVSAPFEDAGHAYVFEGDNIFSNGYDP